MLSLFRQLAIPKAGHRVHPTGDIHFAPACEALEDRLAPSALATGASGLRATADSGHEITPPLTTTKTGLVLILY